MKDSRKKDDQESKDKILDRLIVNIIDTFKFYGIEIKRMSLEQKLPEFDVTVSKVHMKYDLNKTLDFAYWTLVSLVYGKDYENKKILLNYEIVD